MERPFGVKQTANNLVYAYIVPDQCCKRRCHTEFKPDDVRVIEAREPLYDKTTPKSEMRAKLVDNWKRTLIMGDGKPCCKDMATYIYACSNSFLYPCRPSGRTRAEANSANNPVAISICSWFNTQVLDLDVMPVEGWYLLTEPRKSMVHENYEEDCGLFHSYTSCSMDHFYTVWRDSFPHVRLRKHCKFAKCTFCVLKRTEAANRKISDVKRRADCCKRSMASSSQEDGLGTETPPFRQ